MFVEQVHHSFRFLTIAVGFTLESLFIFYFETERIQTQGQLTDKLHLSVNGVEQTPPAEEGLEMKPKDLPKRREVELELRFILLN